MSKGNSTPRTRNSLCTLECVVRASPFESACLVIVGSVNPEEPEGERLGGFAFISPGNLVGLGRKPTEDESVKARVYVTYLEPWEKSNRYAHVILPQPAFPIGERLLVKEDELQEAAYPMPAD